MEARGEAAPHPAAEQEENGKKQTSCAYKHKDMNREVANRIAYLVACVGAFAERFGISNQHAYRYLKTYKGTDFLREFYDIEHTFSIEDAVDDLTMICQRNGGTLA